MTNKQNNVFKINTITPLVNFYKTYQVEYWQNKLLLLKKSITDYSSTNLPSQDKKSQINDENFVRMLKAEIHFTYFQIIETLFEMMFGLEKKDDPNLWYYLTFSDWRKNYDRVDKIAEGEISWLNSETETINKIKMPLVQYIFYFLYDTGLNESEKKDNLDVINSAVILFAKDFSDRDDYNAYKHSLRFFQSPVSIYVAPEGSQKYEVIGRTPDAFIYLKKDQNNLISEVTKSFDAERDFNISMLCNNLIYNIIVARRRYFFKTDELLYNYNKVNLQSLNFTGSSLVKISFSIL